MLIAACFGDLSVFGGLIEDGVDLFGGLDYEFCGGLFGVFVIRG